MAILAQSTKGVQKVPPVILIYGDGGLGKSTFMADAPKAFVSDVEGSTNNLDVTRHKVDKFEDIQNTITELQNEAHGFQTYGIDTLDAMEQLHHAAICQRNGKPNMIQSEGGYGNAFKVAIQEQAALQKQIAHLRTSRNMTIILAAHQIVSTFNDPTTAQGYDRFSIKMHESAKVSAARLWFDFADIVLFAKKKVIAIGDTKRAADLGEHVIYTQGRAAFDAKNRYGLPFELPLRWADFASAMKKGPKSVKEVTTSINELKAQIKDAALLAKISEFQAANGDLPNLLNLEDRIVSILATQEP